MCKKTNIKCLVVVFIKAADPPAHLHGDQGETSEKHKPLPPQATPTPTQKPKQFVWPVVVRGAHEAESNKYHRLSRPVNYNQSQDSLGVILLNNPFILFD